MSNVVDLSVLQQQELHFTEQNLEYVTADEAGYEIVEGVILVAGCNVQAGGCKTNQCCQHVCGANF